jgi:L-aspartate oxidase
MRTDLLIIGSGIAGLSLAIKAGEQQKVLIVTKNAAMESNTRYAQGGIASVMAPLDDFDSHIQDTIEAGAHLCDEKIVEKVICSGPRLIEELLHIGVKFNKNSQDKFDLGIEGGHSKRRILHASDVTGYELERKLLAKVKKSPNIKILEFHAAIDLITDRHLKRKKDNKLCYGAYVLNRKTNRILNVHAKATVLASGGAGKTYLYTSNPDIASGDGVAMAYRAGCAISNLEFVQFHPTCLHHSQAKSFLISEALRGEGGKLRLTNGESFMQNYHHLKELAPRDIVARAIDYELKKRGHKHALLDVSHLSPSFLKKRFPNIYQTCQKFGYNISKQPIPVVPAAHYFCGGVKTNANGRTKIPNLYAIGEVSCTGLHGANRLASNSLLEGIAFADFVFKDLSKRKDLNHVLEHKVKDWDSGKATDSDEAVVITQNWDEIRRMMWNYVGIVRSTKRLIRAQRRINILLDEIKEYYWDFKLTSDLLELRNIGHVADLTIKSALKRKESIGLHYNIDFPKAKKNSLKFNTLYK